MRQNTKRLYSMILALVLLVVSLVFYFDLLVPAYTDLQASKGNEISQQALLDNEKQVVTQIQGLLAAYQSQTAEQQSINNALPVGPNIAGALAQLYGASAADNVTLQNVGISDQSGQASGASTGITGAAAQGEITKPAGTLTFTLTLAGSYENFKNFLRTMETNIRFFDVTQVAIHPASLVFTAPGPSGDFFNYTITANTYYQE